MSSNATPRLTSSSPSRDANHRQGVLEAVVLSVHDLPPSSEQPTTVTLNACGVTVRSGPPVARHKGGNSFRFSSSPTSASNKSDGSASASMSGEPSAPTSNECLELVAPLRDLYKSKLYVRVVFADTSKTLLAEYDLNELHVKQSSWLILSLKPETDGDSALTSKSDELRPTIRLKLQLLGPYRQEIAAILSICNMWFHFVDSIESNLRSTAKHLPALPGVSTNMMLVPLVPALALFVAVLPIIIGVLVVGMPVFAPIAVFLTVGFVGVAATGGLLAASSQHGRAAIGPRLALVVEPLSSSPVGQSIIYDTGPRPSPVSFARQILPAGLWGKLITSLVIDLIGSSSYLIPVAGELVDIAWAPIQTTLVMAMYDEVSPNLKYVSFAEEIMFFTDIVPTATIGWAQEFGPQLVPAIFGQGGIEQASEVAKMLVPTKPGAR